MNWRRWLRWGRTRDKLLLRCSRFLKDLAVNFLFARGGERGRTRCSSYDKDMLSRKLVIFLGQHFDGCISKELED